VYGFALDKVCRKRDKTLRSFPFQEGIINMSHSLHALSRRGLLTAASGAFLLSSRSLVATPLSNGYFDGLSFLPEDLSDLQRAAMGAMVCDVSEVEEVRDAQGAPRYLRTFDRNDKALDAALARISESNSVFVARKGSDIGKRPGCAAFLQFQSGEMVEDDLSRISYFHGKGLRVLQFTHHNTNRLGGGCIETVETGLTPLGFEALDEMNRLRMVPDVAHGSNLTILDAARRSRTPIVYSHGACRSIVDHPRCITDDGIRAVAKTGGTVGIFMMSFWLTRDPEPSIEHLLANIRHVVRLAGIDAVSISNDFPVGGQANLLKLSNDNKEGVKEYLEWWNAMRDKGIPGFENLPEHVVIPELNAIDRLSTIAAALERDGYSPAHVEKVMGGNLARVMREVLG